MGYQRDWLNEQDQKGKERRAERKVWQKQIAHYQIIKLNAIIFEPSLYANNVIKWVYKSTWWEQIL